MAGGRYFAKLGYEALFGAGPIEILLVVEEAVESESSP